MIILKFENSELIEQTPRSYILACLFFPANFKLSTLAPFCQVLSVLCHQVASTKHKARIPCLCTSALRVPSIPQSIQRPCCQGQASMLPRLPAPVTIRWVSMQTGSRGEAADRLGWAENRRSFFSSHPSVGSETWERCLCVKFCLKLGRTAGNTTQTSGPREAFTKAHLKCRN